LVGQYTSLRHQRHYRRKAVGVSPPLGDNIIACYQCDGLANIQITD